VIDTALIHTALIDTALPDPAGTVTPVTGASRRSRGHHTGHHTGQDLVVDDGMSVVPAR